MFWSHMTMRAKVLSILAGSVTAVAAMIVAVASAWAVLDLPILATRDYVLAQAEPLARAQRELRDVTFEIRRGQLDREIFALEQLPTRTPNEEFRLRQLRDELRKLDARK